jgi:23S rRNA (uracil1939-C5)-methyltransferase
MLYFAIMTSITEKMVAGGSCIARIDGKAVFIPFTLPGETVDIEITDSKKDYSFARLLGVKDPSPHRITPPCPLFAVCGGCSLQMADPGYQTELRLSILSDSLARAHVPFEGRPSALTGEPLGYRSRFQFHRTRDGRVGLKEGKSDSIVPVSDCPVAVRAIRDSLVSGELARITRKHNVDDRFHVFSDGDRLWVEDIDNLCTVRILGREISFDVKGFFQSNLGMLERALEAVCKGLAEGTRLLDFYSGVGTFSVFAGHRFKETVLVEHNREALAMAEKNLAWRDGPITLCAVSDERWPRDPASRLEYDCAIVDPPRQGIGKAALEWFAASKIPELRYVSCDPVTFARDAARLCASGFSLDEVTLLDFYPQTSHIETFGVFRR